MELTDLLIQELTSLFAQQAAQIVIAAVSGGGDSMVLLHLLAAMRKTFGYELVAAHVHHGLRAETADRDAELVRSTATAWGIPYEFMKINVLAEVAETGESVETAGRRLRYSALANLASGYRDPLIMTAHHLDDQAETVLDRLMRGAGLTGLAGMVSLRTLYGVPVARPLLNVEKAALIEYARQQDVPYFEDETNVSLRYRRNRIRHELLPYLKRSFNPGIVFTLAHEAEIIRAENEYMEYIARKYFTHTFKKSKNRFECNCERFLRLPLALQRRVVKLVLEYLKIHLQNGFEEIEGVRRLLLQGQGKLALGKGFLLIVEQGSLRIVKEYEANEYAQGMYWMPTTVDRASFFSIRCLKWIVKTSEQPIPQRFSESLWEAWLALDETEQLLIRVWRQGDRILPLGMTGSKLLSDVFIDSKVPREWRAVYPVFVVGQEIVWVPGLVRSRTHLVRKDFPEAVHVSVWPAMED